MQMRVNANSHQSMYTTYVTEKQRIKSFNCFLVKKINQISIKDTIILVYIINFRISLCWGIQITVEVFLFRPTIHAIRVITM
jgi:hypothetical protein